MRYIKTRTDYLNENLLKGKSKDSVINGIKTNIENKTIKDIYDTIDNLDVDINDILTKDDIITLVRNSGNEDNPNEYYYSASNYYNSYYYIDKLNLNVYDVYPKDEYHENIDIEEYIGNMEKYVSDIENILNNSPEFYADLKTEFHNSDYSNILSNNLPQGIGILKNDDGSYYISFNEWNNFTDLFVNIENDDYTKSILSQESDKFYGFNSSYGDIGEVTIDSDLLSELKTVTLNEIDVDEIDVDELNNANDVKTIYDICCNHYIDIIKSAIDDAYERALSVGTADGAFNELSEAIIDRFNIDINATVTTENNNDFNYKINNHDELLTFDIYIKYLIEEDVELFDIDYSVPYYGFDTKVNDEEFIFQLGEGISNL